MAMTTRPSMSLPRGPVPPSVLARGDGIRRSRHRRPHRAQGPLVDRTAHLRRRPRRFRRLRDLGEPPERQLLRGSLPLAVLLALPRAEPPPPRASPPPPAV